MSCLRPPPAGLPPTEPVEGAEEEEEEGAEEEEEEEEEGGEGLEEVRQFMYLEHQNTMAQSTSLSFALLTWRGSPQGGIFAHPLPLFLPTLPRTVRHSTR